MFGIVSKLVFSKNKNENENGVLQLLYFEFKYVFDIIFYILYFKIENNNKCSIDTIEKR